ncbi:MAG: prepilin-type N-terminal cleavage/methylation domain-containing protein [Syntrophales bacterium]|jgi:prepilin-type N-terminal cleavage/methylation domain-containing protein|nr:prepilin-type N-terminal cleavage/methylation domain-containing protein [Syntrophales bacterium]
MTEMKVHHYEKRRDGFTVLEVIAVIFVIAVVGVVATSRIASKTYYDIAAETEILKANIRYAQFRALSDADKRSSYTDTTWGVLFSGNSYTLRKTEEGVTTTHNFPGQDSPTHNLPSGISVTAGTVTYNVWGVPVDASGAALDGETTIEITDGVSTKTITVTRNTGFIP